MKRKPIDLIIEEYVNIKNNYKCLGSGVDGSVYKVSADTVFKFYHKDDSLNELSSASLEEVGKTISKSALNHRFREIHDLYVEIEANAQRQ